MIKNFKKNPAVIIVDDHLIFRQGLKAIINFENIGSVIGEASSGEEFIELLTVLKPDLVLMDIDLPNMNGIEATIKALEIKPDLKIIAFTVFAEEEYYKKMFDIGAKGFILKSVGFYELENAIAFVMNGGRYFSSLFQKAINNEKEDNEFNEVDNEVYNIKRNGKMQFFPWHVKGITNVNVISK